MLPEIKLKEFHQVINGYTQEELVWLNGYLNGLVSAQLNVNQIASTSTVPQKITLLYGTETGNAKSLSTQLAAIAKKNGIQCKLVSLDQYRLADLHKEERLFIVISTQGEGEPPIGAKKFYDFIFENTISLKNTQFSVLGLGDSSYPLFCKTGEDVDTQLQVLGAKRILPLQKCDVDYNADALLWFNQVINYVQSNGNTEAASIRETTITSTTKHTKKVYDGTIVANINLNDKGSLKETYHIEITTQEKIEYETGDALAIIPTNKAFVVDTILTLTNTPPNTLIETTKQTGTVKDLLLTKLNICYLLSSVIKKYAAIVGTDIPDTRMDLLDLIRIYPVANSAQFIEVVKILTPIAPRLYTIASSSLVYENEIHILVRRDEYMLKEEKKYGLCSDFLGDVPVNSTLQFYIHKNKHFRLPESNKDIIMIGPGTGIAPFRAFLQERDAQGATGKNWLFFGEHFFQKDFLYQTEIQNWLHTGTLHKLSLAFSRNQPEKLYVQHKIQQQANEFFKWIQNGATVYVSGTKNSMSVDVEKCLLQTIQDQGFFTEDDAKQYFEHMKKEGRYQKEVY